MKINKQQIIIVMTKYDVIIAIDPDTEKSGVAVLEPATRQIEAMSLTFPRLLDFLCRQDIKAKAGGYSLAVIVEGGWLVHKSNWHGTDGHRAERIAKNVGANHETGRKIVEMCRHWGIHVEEQRPLQKMWRGKGGKITAAELQAITGLTSRTNQDERDAALLAWVWAGLPVRIRTEDNNETK